MKSDLNNSAQIKEQSPGETFYTHNVAEQYELLRKSDRYWDWENKIIDKCLMLVRDGAVVADCPVGTGRFFGAYGRHHLEVLGIDISADMLREAEKKIFDSGLTGKTRLMQADVSNMQLKFPQADALVCFRLLHLISEKNIDDIVAGLSKLPSQYVFLQIFAVKDYDPRSVVRRIMSTLRSNNIGLVRKLKYLYRTIRSIAVYIFGIRRNRVVKAHELDTFCDVTYSHNIKNVLSMFASYGFEKVEQYDLLDKDHMMGESGANVSMILVMKKEVSAQSS